MTKIEIGTVRSIEATQVDGCAINPSDLDILALVGTLSVGEPVPEGWRVLTGNSRISQVAAVCFRYEAPEV